MAMIELVDYNEVYNPGKAKKSKSTRRSRRGGGGAKPAATPVVEKTETKEEE
jgi:large subunit ribosomal protein L17